MNEPIIKSTSDATIETVAFAYKAGEEQFKPIQIDGFDFTLGHKAAFITSQEAFRQAPDRIKRKITLADPQSLVEYLLRFKAAQLTDGQPVMPLLVGSLTNKTVTATIDYDLPGGPSWCDHVAAYRAAYSPEWAALLAVNGKEKSQLAMAEWFDEWSHIITEPTAGHMADVASNLQGSVNGAFEAKIVRSNGAVTMRYQEDVETNNVKVPTKIKVTCSPFEGTPPIVVDVRFQFRISERKPVFKVIVQNVERIERQALAITFGKIEEGTGLKVLVAP